MYHESPVEMLIAQYCDMLFTFKFKQVDTTHYLNILVLKPFQGEVRYLSAARRCDGSYVASTLAISLMTCMWGLGPLKFEPPQALRPRTRQVKGPNGQKAN
jgi:hypothetical protein